MKASWPSAAAALIALAAVLYGGWKVFAWWHDASVLQMLGTYCGRSSEGCRLWITGEGEFHAINAEDLRQLERDQRKSPAITRPSTSF